MALRALLPLLFLTWATVVFADHVGQVSGSRLSFIINGNVLKIPYYRNLSLTGSYPQVDRAVVDVHGDARNASQSLDNMVAAAAVAGVADSTALLIAPPFLIEEDKSSGTGVPTAAHASRRGSTSAAFSRDRQRWRPSWRSCSRAQGRAAIE
jgi:hypothetical protein